MAGAQGRWLTPLLVLAVMGIAPPVTSGGTGEQIFQYEIHALGGPAGKAALTLGSKRKLKRRTLQSVRLEAQTVGQAHRVYPFKGGGTSWIDEDGLTVRTNWDSEMPLGRSKVKVKALGKRLKGTNHRGSTHKVIDHTLDARPLDMIGSIAWLGKQPLKKGLTLTRPVFLGLRVYEMTAVVGEPVRSHLPIGVREVWPVRIEAVGHGKTFRVEAHYTVRGQVPALLRFRIRALGVVDVRLASRRAR